jgi:hypothetical protein
VIIPARPENDYVSHSLGLPSETIAVPVRYAIELLDRHGVKWYPRGNECRVTYTRDRHTGLSPCGRRRSAVFHFFGNIWGCLASPGMTARVGSHRLCALRDIRKPKLYSM